MPIEIRELVIRMQVVDDRIHNKQRKKQPTLDEHQIVERCVEKVVKIMKKKIER
jgi:hypothetical protein